MEQEGDYFGSCLGGHDPSVTGCWGHGRSATVSGCPWWLPPLAAEPELARSTRPLSQNPTALLESSPNPKYTESAGLGSTEKPFGGNPKPRSSYSENLPPPEGRKDHETQHFPARHFLHRGGTGQPGVGGSAAIFTLRFPELSTNLGYRTPQSTQLHPQRSQEV